MHHIKRMAITLSEMMVSISLIGLLAVTMLSLNQVSANDYKIAQVKMQQTEQSIRAWGHTITANDETGLGAIYFIQSQDDLSNSLCNYFNATKLSNDNNEAFEDVFGIEHDTYDNIKLSNGVIIKVDYNVEGPECVMIGGKQYCQNLYDSAIATIRIEVPIENKGAVMTQDLDLKAFGIRDSKQRLQ